MTRAKRDCLPVLEALVIGVMASVIGLLAGLRLALKLLHRLGVPPTTSWPSPMTAPLVVLAWSQDLAEGRAHPVSESLARSSVPALLPVASSRRRRSRPAQ